MLLRARQLRNFGFGTIAVASRRAWEMGRPTQSDWMSWQVMVDADLDVAVKCGSGNVGKRGVPVCRSGHEQSQTRAGV